MILRSGEIKEIGERIRAARRDANLTQDELGEALGLSGNAISKIENGYSSITVESLLKLPSILDRSLSYFLNIQTDFTTDESEFLDLYRALPPGFAQESAKDSLRTFLGTVRRNRGLGDDGKPLLTGQGEKE